MREQYTSLALDDEASATPTSNMEISKEKPEVYATITASEIVDIEKAVRLHEYGIIPEDGELQKRIKRANVLLNQDWNTASVATSVFQTIEKTPIIQGANLSRGIQALLHRSAGEDPYSNAGHLSKEYMAARKEFMVRFIDQVKSRVPFEEKNATPFAEQFRVKAEQVLFSYSPNFLDYIGSLDDRLEVATRLREVPELHRVYNNFLEGLVNSLEFSNDQEGLCADLQNWIHTASSEKKFKIIRTLHEVAKAAWGAGYTRNIFPLLLEVLDAVDSQSALSTLVAQELSQNIRWYATDDNTPLFSNIAKDEYYGLSQVVTLPEQWQQCKPAHIAKNTIGLRNKYGEVSAVASINSAAIYEESPNSDTKILLQLHQGFEKYGRRIQFDNLDSYPEFFQDPVLAKEVKEAIQKRGASGLQQVVSKHVAEFQKQTRRQMVNENDVYNFYEAFPGIDSAYIELFQELHQPEVREIIQNSLGINLTHVSLQAQMWLLRYLAESDTKRFSRLRDRLSKINGDEAKGTLLDSFLSLEKGGEEMGEKILDIAEQIPPDISLTIFSKYTELVEHSQDIESWLAKEFKGDALPNTTSAIANRLLERGKDLLLDFHQKTLRVIQELNRYNKNFQLLEEGQIERPGYEENEYKDEVELAGREYENALDIIKTELSKLNAEQLTLLQTFKTLKETGTKVSLEDFQNTSFTDTHGAELPAGEVSHMRSLYADSMQGYPEATKQELLADFDRHISDEQSRFSLLRYKGEIAGFLCFTEEKPGQKYISAVTLDPRFQKAYIGEAMIDEAFAREAENNILGADCVAQKSVSSRYIENGFIGVRSWDDKGDLIMDIVRDDRRNEKYFSTKSLTQDEIIKLAPLGRIGTARIEVVGDPKEHTFSLCNEGFVLTRYFKDQATKKWYLVYEPKPTKAPATKSIPHKEEALA